MEVELTEAGRNQIDISKKVKRTQMTVIIQLIFISTIVVFLVMLFTYVPENPAAKLLISTGASFFGMGGVALVLSEYPSLEIEKFWENYDITPAQSYYIFRTIHEGELNLSFQLKDANFDIKIHEYIPYQLKKAVTKEVFSTRIKLDTPVNCPIHPGEYVMTIRAIGSKKNTGSSFSLKYSFMYHIFSPLHDLGLTILEIGAPLLISGIVLLLI